MLERKRGVILSISSAAGVVTAGSPMLAMYSGTKAFVERFSTSLAGVHPFPPHHWLKLTPPAMPTLTMSLGFTASISARPIAHRAHVSCRQESTQAKA